MSGSPTVAISQSRTATMRVRSAGSRTRLSYLKSLWTRAAPPVHGVELGQAVGEGGRERGEQVGAELDAGDPAAPQDDAAHALHEVELGAGHRRVVAEGQRPRRL